MSYGGRWDLVQAAQKLAGECARGALRVQEITEQPLRRGLAAGGPAGAGSVHPHRWRAAHQQFPALGSRLHRALFLRAAVAGVRRRRARCGSRVSSRAASVASARPASRPSQATVAPERGQQSSNTHRHSIRARRGAVRRGAAAAAAGDGVRARRAGAHGRLGMVGVSAQRRMSPLRLRLRAGHCGAAAGGVANHLDSRPGGMPC